MSNLNAAIDAINAMVSEKGAPDKMTKEQQDDMTLMVVTVGLETARNIERIADALNVLAVKALTK